MKQLLGFLWRHRIYGALTFLGAIALLGLLYALSGHNAADAPFFYSTR